MTVVLVVYTNPLSRGRIVRWMLVEVSQPYRTELLDYGTAMKAPASLALNPMGKVPALRHGDVVVTEAAAICTYLADAFPQAGLAPPHGDRLRGTYYRWLFFTAGPLESAAMNKGLGLEIPAGKERMLGYGAYAHVIDAVDGLLSEHNYVLGDRFSAADVCLGSQIGWGVQFGTIEKRPAFERYWQRVSNRSAAIRAKEIDDKLMPPKAPQAA